MMQPPTHLRFGLLLNGMQMKRWQVQCVEMLRNDPRMTLELIVLPEDLPDTNNNNSRRWDSIALYKIYRRYFHRPESLQDESPEWVHRVPLLRCAITKQGHGEFFSDEDVKRMASHRLDFMLRLGFNIIRGKILSVARYGVWSFHHGDEQLYRGGPPAFWETLHGRSDCGAILQKLTPTLDGGVVLKKGHFAVSAHSLAETHDVLLKHTAGWPLQVARDILNGVLNLEILQPVSTKAPVYRFPKNGTMLRFAVKLVFGKIRFHYRELFRPEHWNVGVVDQVLEDILSNDLKNVRWLPSQPAHRFRADPFGWVDGDTARLLFEDYGYGERKGLIRSEDEKPLFSEEDFHLSYPFLFVFEGQWYCLPESFESRSVRLYRWNEKQQQFIFFRTLLHDVELTDPTLQEIDGRWWLFSTPRALSNTSLHLYYSDSPFGLFKPHENNPVKWDVRGARPAGHLFQHYGIWYRPAQDCSVSYGSRVVIHRIEEISPTAYRETQVKTIEPIAPYSDGLHTLSRWGNRTLIDGKRYRFNWPNFVFQLKRKLGINT